MAIPVQIGWLLEALGPQWGWLLPLAWVMWQIYAPKFFDRETLTSSFYNELERTKKLQTAHMMVSRAMARVLDDDLDTSINSEQVDDYLADNGVTVEHFLDEDEEVTDMSERPFERGDE